MIKTNVKTTTTPTYAHSADCPKLEARLEDLINELVASSLSAELLAQSLAGGMDDIATMVRAIPGHEGRLIERGIALVARCNPDLVVLTQNLRLPVTATALQLVGMNDPQHYRALTLDADHGGRKTYTPDLLIVNSRTKVAHVVDAKRSLISYESARIDELKKRMLAASLIVPDLLYKEHRRLVAEEVRIVILNAENRKTDVEAGIWPMSHLDHLVEVAGAGEAIGLLQQTFRSRITANWELARRTFIRSSSHRGGPLLPTTAAVEEAEPDDEAVQNDDEDAVTDTYVEPRLIKLGFAQVPARH
ncbi:hypothetical protein [Hoeflea sp.]|uniref:hypothetical protein n=1 Tax=Hoeflea sp. TaxID=1940281 RepID=UPI003A94B9BC